MLTVPALAALRERFPGAHLEVLGYAHIASLALAGKLVDAVRSIEAGPLAGFFARHGELSPDLAEYFGNFHVIISYLYDPEQVFRMNVARCSTAQFIQGPHRPDERTGQPASRAFLQPLERLAIFEADPVPRLSIDRPASQQPARQRGSGSLLAAHPGSGSETKNWSERSWTELLTRITRQTEILLVGGEAEGDRLERLAKSLPPKRCQLAKNLPLPTLASCLAECDAFIGHDSGISHLAAAIGLPGLVLWGDSVEGVWRPPSERVIVLREPGGLDKVSVERVWQALGELLAAAARSDG